MRAIFLFALCLLPVSVFSGQPASPQDAAKAKQMQQMQERNSAPPKLTEQERESRAKEWQKAQERDLQQAEQARKNAPQEKPDRWKTTQNTQTKIFEIQKDVTANKARTQDKVPRKADEHIRK
jgi:hypothetical protein